MYTKMCGVEPSCLCGSDDAVSQETGRWQRNPLGEEPSPLPAAPSPTTSTTSTISTSTTNQKLYCQLCKVFLSFT